MSRASAFRFLCDCLAGIPSGRKPVLESRTFGWTTFIALAHEYRVSATVASATDGLASVPDDAKAVMTALAVQQRQRNGKVREQAISVASIFNEIGVTPIFLKGGAHLLTKLYGESASRQLSDLDILVAPTRLDDCVAALSERGATRLTADLHPRSHHYYQLGHSDWSLPIELHRHVLAYPHFDFLTSEEVHASAVRLQEGGASFAVPSPTHAMFHNIAHAQLNDHDWLYGRVDLRGLLDLALLSNVHAGSIDWDEIHRRFVSAGRRRALDYHVQWARRLGARIPARHRPSRLSRLLYRRALYHVRKPKALSASVRLLRPFVLLRREVSDSGLRQRLAGNILKPDWWKRHLRMLTDA